ncbi:MAG: JAB domain-containing protein [Clostridia bacterium]|nr:JAB domain-containing protein [Clostridia bacterium]
MSVLFEIQKIQRLENAEKIKIATPKDIYNIPQIQEIKDATQEHLIVITLNTKNIITSIELIGVGRIDSINIDAKDVIRPALIQASSGIIIVHNHPSGDTTPSKQDIGFTARIEDMARLFNISLLDHIVVGDGYLSMKEMGSLEYKGSFEKEKFNNETIDELKKLNSSLVSEIESKDKKISMLEKQINKYKKQISKDEELEI